MENSQEQLNENAENQSAAVKVRVPKRVLHFCDGTIEEYSDEEEVDSDKEQALVDPKTLAWAPWMWYKAWAVGSTTLSACDYVGEFLADIFGITTPKYYFEIEEYRRREAEKQKQAEESKGWSTSRQEAQVQTVSVNQPAPANV